MYDIYECKIASESFNVALAQALATHTKIVSGKYVYRINDSAIQGGQEKHMIKILREPRTEFDKDTYDADTIDLEVIEALMEMDFREL
jgi:hypothetical protein